jgi:ATP-dependent DNA ligase
MAAPFKPMLCHDAKDGLPTDASEWALEGKFDGWRTLVSINGDVGLYGGRNGATYTGKVPYIEESLRAALPPDTLVDGELISASGTAGGVQTIMAAGGAHKPNAFSPALTLVVFDVILLNGADVKALPYSNRRSLLEMIQWPTHTYLSPVGECSEANHQRMLELGLEGSVLKRRTSPYMPGARSRDWLKMKFVDSEDCEIIGFEQGEGASNQHQLGAFVVKLPTGVETTIKIPTKRDVEAVTADPDAFRGRIVEVAHNGVMASGKLRHPRFLRWREDRDKPQPAPKAKPKRKPRARQKSMRNYNAMGNDKLMACIAELNGGYGDAYQRVQTGQYAGDLTEHIVTATAVARVKGLL